MMMPFPFSPTAVLIARRRSICTVCTLDIEKPVMIEEGREWELHEKSRTHKKLLNRANRIKAGGHQYPKQQEKQKAEDHAFDAPTP